MQNNSKNNSMNARPSQENALCGMQLNNLAHLGMS